MVLSPADWHAIALTAQLAGVTTFLLLVLASPLAWWLSQTPSAWRAPVAAAVALPLVLPPTVLGFYLLLTLGPQGTVGQVVQWLGLQPLPFTFTGLLLGSLVYSLPFAVQPLQHAFEAQGRRPMEVAATLGVPPIRAFFRVALPLARNGYLTAGVLTFAHTVGEFGVVLMMGGNIPGQTQVVSTQLFNHVEAMEYTEAHVLAAVLVAFSFAVLLFLGRLGRSPAKVSV